MFRICVSALAIVAVAGLTGCGVQRQNPPAAPKAVAEPAAPSTAPASPTPAAPQKRPFLHTEGRQIVDEAGQPVQLSGCNIGGWLLLEPWIAGLDNQKDGETEKDIWDLMGERFGEDSKQDLIRTFRQTFFDESDVRRVAEIGMNCIRVPIWWRAVSDPQYGGDIAYLDRFLDWCEANGVYAILDLQGAPGGQAKESANVGERSDGGRLWREQALKDRTVEWWKAIAARYKDRAIVAAYDLLNEGTAAPKHDDLVQLYDTLYKEIRKIDPKHIIVFEDVWGYHRLPHPLDMGWENCVYSFHFYPQTSQEGLEADATAFHRYNRTALYDGVPVYVGEFNPIVADRGGADAFLKYREVCEYFRWAWTFWTYKKIEDNDNVTWGLYGYFREKPTPDLNQDSFETIRNAFRAFATTNTAPHPLLPAALRAPIRWEPDPDFGPGGVTLSLRDACVVAGEKGYLRYEWGVTPPNLGYWTAGDTVAWKVDLASHGVYELGFELANNSDRNVAQVWVDGVHAFNAPIDNTKGYRRYAGRTLGRLDLSAGGHVIEIAQGDSEKGFVNLRLGWLKPAREAAEPADESALWLKPFNMTMLRPKSPLRVEWLNNPPNLGNWDAGEKAAWRITLKKGGRFMAKASYATPNDDSTMQIMVDGKPAVAKVLPATKDWQTYRSEELGIVGLGAGEHTVAVVWNVNHPTAAGNLRDIRMESVPGATAGQGK